MPKSFDSALLLTPESVKIFIPDKALEFPFPTDTFVGQTVTNEIENASFWKNIKKQLPPNPAILFVFDQSFLYEKPSHLSLDDFIASLPINQQYIRLKNNYAINSNLLFEFFESLSPNKDKSFLISVNELSKNLPPTYLNLTQSAKSLKTDWYHHSQTIETYKNTFNHPKASKKFPKKLLLLLLLLPLAFIPLFIKKPTQPNPVATSVTTTPSPTPTTTPTPTPFDKQLLSISIENGTGTPGQAGKLKSLLEASNFSNISTGNAQSKSSTTKIIYPDTLPPTILSEITTILNSNFTTVESTSSSSTTLTIITGTSK